MNYLLNFLLIFSISIFDCNGISVHERIFNEIHKGPDKPKFNQRSNVLTKWIEQKVDHFNETDTRTWKMRYMENGLYFKSNGPIFIFVGGEWEISENFIVAGHMFDIAKDNKGYMFYTEHRYYGKSFPTKDLSVENLKYLSVQQSLADLAYFIKTVKSTYEDLKNSKVVLVGGSYSGTMVTWFQRLYPGVAVASWASSAPLLAKVNFVDYKEIVGESINLVGGEGCYDRIYNSFHLLEELINKNSSYVLKLFNVCNNFDLKNNLDVWSFFGSLSDAFSGLVQTHSKGNIESACKQIASKENDLEGVVGYLTKYLNQEKCNDFSYSELVNSMNYVDLKGAMRQWIYQTCSEYGWYQTSQSKKQPFGSNFPLELYTELCKDLFGKRFSNATIYENANKTNKIFGGMNPNVKNVIWTHGQLDPWRSMGIQKLNGESFVIPLYAHCKDFASINSSDSPEMIKAKLKTRKSIEKWLLN